MAVTCPGFLSPLCNAVGGGGSSLLGLGAGAVLSAMAGWVVAGAGWLLTQVGAVLAATTKIDVGAHWFVGHYQVMVAVASVVVVPLLLAAVVQAIYRQSATALVRAAFVHLPLAAILTGVAIEMVQLSLGLVDSLCTAVSSGAGVQLGKLLTDMATILVAQGAGSPTSAPTFVVLLVALLVALGALLLWLELLVRAAAVYVAVLFLPLALATLAWPAVSHWCRRLVDTLVALVLSKFVIVSVLSLALGALTGDGGKSGVSSVLGGAALLLLAAFAPFTLLRLVPAIEAGAALHLEGARQRVRHAAGSVPQSAAMFALRRARDLGGPFTPGQPGSTALGRHAAGSAARHGATGAGDLPGAADTAGAGGLPMWTGSPASNAAFEAAMAGPPAGSGAGSSGAGIGAGMLPGGRPSPISGGSPPGGDTGLDAGIDAPRRLSDVVPTFEHRRTTGIGRDWIGPVLHPVGGGQPATPPEASGVGGPTPPSPARRSPRGSGDA